MHFLERYTWQELACKYWCGSVALIYKSVTSWLFVFLTERSSPAQKNKFSIKDFFSKCDQILSFLKKNKKNIRNTKVVYLQRITSKPELVYAYKRHAYKKTCTSNSFVALPRLRATAVDCAVDYAFFLFLTFGRILLITFSRRPPMFPFSSWYIIPNLSSCLG